MQFSDPDSEPLRPENSSTVSSLAACWGQGQGQGQGQEENGSGPATVTVDNLDYVHFVIADISGIPCGRVVPGRFANRALNSGIDLFYGKPCLESLVCVTVTGTSNRGHWEQGEWDGLTYLYQVSHIQDA